MNVNRLALLNIVALVAVLTVNALANILPINGMNTGQISELYPSLFTPAGFTFSIWSLLYLLMISFVVYQFAIRQERYFGELSLWFLASCVANISWILVWHYLMPLASVVVMLFLLFTLTKIFLLLQVQVMKTWAQRIFVKITFTFYLSWICVATIANISTLLLAWEWSGAGVMPTTWTIIMISVASILGIFIAERFREPAFLLVLMWAFFGIYSKWDGTMNSSIAQVAGGEIIVLAIVFLVLIIGVGKTKTVATVIVGSVLLFSCQEVPQEKIDHIILAVNNLESGMKQFEEITGVKPMMGGKHPNTFTQNALVALDNQSYIEILAPRTDVDSIPEWIMKLDRLTPFGWAVTSSDLDATNTKLASLGFLVSEIKPGSRAKPDGTLLTWRTLAFENKEATVFPFFIEWGKDVIHPSVTSPQGCTLEKLNAATTDPSLKLLYEKLAIRVDVEERPTNQLTVALRTPKGEVVFPQR